MPAFIQHITGVTTLLGCYMQRYSASFGLNSSPSQVDVELVPGNANDPVASGFMYASGEPGTLARFRFGSLDFIGHIRSYTENLGTDGRKYSVSLGDPRIIFPNVVLSLDGFGVGTGTYVPNYFNVFNYYGSPQAADSNRYGMTFSKIRDFLTTTGIINAWGNRFQLEFSSGFQNLATGTNPSGIPTWYRIPAGQASLDSILQQVSSDFNIDYHAYIKQSTFDATGGINTIVVQHIFRNADAVGSSEISGFINSALTSGVRIGYQYGKELRSDPTDVVAYGPPLTYWKCPQSSELELVWGETNNGTLIKNGFTASGGMVSLENVKCSGSERIVSTITVQDIDFYKETTGITYPPQITRVFSSDNIKGYLCTEETFRAALFSQEAWECLLWKHHNAFALELGMTAQPFRGPNTLIGKPSDIEAAFKIAMAGSGVTNRDDITKEVLASVYQATRETADSYYGTTWLARVGSSNWLASGTFDSSELTPRIEFSAVDAAWSEPGRGLPSGATLNHPRLQDTSNLTFKDNLGLTKGFLSVYNYDIAVDAVYFPYPVDLSQFNRGEVLFESSKLVVPISIQPYEKEPSKAIIRIASPLTAITTPSGYLKNNPYYAFLKALEFTDAKIRAYHLMDSAGDNQAYGLAPQRLHHDIPISSDVYGFFIPVQRNEKSFGPFIATGTRCGGVNVINDSSLAPWVYGNMNVYNDAGSGIIGRAYNGITSVESAQISIAGMPVYNLGDKFGENANITAITSQVGGDGMTTNYTVKTFTSPRITATKTLQDKFTFVGGLGQKQKIPNKTIQDFTFLVPERSDVFRNLSALRKQLAGTQNTFIDPWTQANFGDLCTVVQPAISGLYPSGTISV